MRTTLTLDDDIAAYARAHARRERISLGEAISRLARDGIKARSQPQTTLAQPKSRYAILPARSEVITTEHVRALMDQEGL
jgi:hypothetical protein